MTSLPTHAMVLAAGLGLRMRPITDHTPKPLVAVGGRTMLDRALDHLAAVGVAQAVVNVHHLAARIRDHLTARTDGPQTVISDETDAVLETGGGVAKALPLLGSAPFYVCNADIIWTDGPRPALRRLAEAFDPLSMDACLLLTPRDLAHGYDGPGDFLLDDAGRPVSRDDRPTAPFVFAGVQILTPGVFAGTPAGAWSLRIVYDRLLKAGRLGALVHDGQWFHVGTPQAIAPTAAVLGTD